MNLFLTFLICYRLEKGKLPKEEEKELSFLRSYWNDDKLDEGEKFLRDYILNRKYKEEDHEEVEKDHVPSYNAIVHDSDEDLSNDEQFEQKREEFEHKYNFRFEEPDPEFVSF
jgi:protein KRI1